MKGLKRFEKLREKGHLILIAEAQAQIVGVLHILFYLVHGRLNSHILLLYVKEGYRGKGIGKALLDEAVKHAVKRRTGEMHVDTIFEDVVKFYRKYGFKDDGVMLELSLIQGNLLSYVIRFASLSFAFISASLSFLNVCGFGTPFSSQPTALKYSSLFFSKLFLLSVLPLNGPEGNGSQNLGGLSSSS